jgi:hypothetical protein
MKVRIFSLLALASLILAFAFLPSTPAAPNKANVPAAPAASALPATTTATPAEPHPQIREALRALRRAKEHLEHAAHDFGGHRVEALAAGLSEAAPNCPRCTHPLHYHDSPTVSWLTRFGRMRARASR